MNYDNTIRVFDPFYGWGNHAAYKKIQNDEDFSDDYIKGSDDTGLCNRLLHWELFCDMHLKSNRPNSRVGVQDFIWPELKLIYLPDTTSVSYNMHDHSWYGNYKHINLYFKTVFDLETDSVRVSKKITQEDILLMYDHNDFELLNSYDHWCTIYGYITLRQVYERLNKRDEYLKLNKRPIHNIRISDDYINSRVRASVVSKIGIHIRRGNGVSVTEGDIQSLPHQIQEDYRRYIRTKFTVMEEVYKFIQDSMYFDFIDSVLEINPHQEFYISHDLPDEFMNHYYERYGDSISTKKDNRDYYLNYYSSKLDNLDNLISYGNIIDNIIDLFSLSNCGYLVKSDTSSWSEFAGIYKKKKSHNITEIFENMKNNKNDFLLDILSFKNYIDLL